MAITGMLYPLLVVPLYSPPALLEMMTPTAPAATALSVLSWNVPPPRRMWAMLPLTVRTPVAEPEPRDRDGVRGSDAGAEP